MARVLLVDDERSIRLTLREFLQDAGHQVEVAENAVVAEELLRVGGFDVVLSDIIMPQMTGVELLRLIRQAAARVQVILMTGAPTVETAAEAVRAGAFDYLTKPVAKAAVLRSVASAAKIKAVDDERFRLTESNQLYQSKLEQLVADRTHDLRGSNRLLQDALEKLKRTQQEVIKRERLSALAQMVCGIAHDFNNALMPILGLPDFLLDKPELLSDPPVVQKALMTIRAAAHDARDIVRRLRGFYRPGLLDTQPLNVRDVVEHVVALTEPAWKGQAEAAGKHIRIETSLTDTRAVCGNEPELRGALANLVLNAVDAIEKEGVVRISTLQDDSWTTIQVSDTGAGMTAEVTRHCFEPFFTTKGEAGSGLGLAMCYGAVHRYGGSIDVASEVGAGTTFTIRLPLVQTECRPPDAGLPAAVSLPGKPQRVLAIDDDDTSRALLVDFLERGGHVVESASGGAEGLAKLRARGFDVVVTDRAMPGMCGDEVAKEVKNVAPDTFVLMLTGFGDLMKHRQEYPEGVDEILSKPVTPDEVLTAVARLVHPLASPDAPLAAALP